MPQEFQYSRDVLSYRAFYVLRRPLGSATTSSAPAEEGAAGNVKGWERPPSCRPRTCRASQAKSLSSGAAWADVSCTRPDSKCFGLCRPGGLSGYSALLVVVAINNMQVSGPACVPIKLY